MIRTARPRSNQDNAGLRRFSATLATCLGLAVTGSALAQEGRAVVVHPQPNGTPVQLGPNERVGSATSVNTPGGPAIVLRIDQQPPAPDFTIVTPNGNRMSFRNGETTPGTDIQKTYQRIIVQTPNGDKPVVIITYKRNGQTIGTGRMNFPVGSQTQSGAGNSAATGGFIPQPPGAAMMAPGAFPIPAEDEAMILGELGLPDFPEPDVWAAPGGLILLFADGAEPDEVFMTGGPIPGDMNCDGAVTVGDINPFVLALTDPLAYGELFPTCDALAGDVNADLAVTVSDINGFVELVLGGD